MECYKCEESTENMPVVRHPVLGVRHVSCGKIGKICKICHMTLPCECD